MIKSPRRLRIIPVKLDSGAPARFKVKGTSLRKYKKFLKRQAREWDVEIVFSKKRRKHADG